MSADQMTQKFWMFFGICHEQLGSEKESVIIIFATQKHYGGMSGYY